MAKIFIDGGHGTTGLEIVERLKKRGDLELLQIPEARRKLTQARLEIYAQADVVVLCLPDEASREIVSQTNGLSTKMIDCSSAFRVDDSWAYGLPELSSEYRKHLAESNRVSNPGCYATNFNLIVAPLVKEGLLPSSAKLNYFGVSGYSGGGKSLIAEFEENENTPDFFFYAMDLRHKHLPEMQKHSGLLKPPLFQPGVGNFYRGMLGAVALDLEQLPMNMQREKLLDFYADYYNGQTFIKVQTPEENLKGKRLYAEKNVGTNFVDLLVSMHGETAEVLVCSDNLGKGAGGAAVQNLNLMLGLDESTGLL